MLMYLQPETFLSQPLCAGPGGFDTAAKFCKIVYEVFRQHAYCYTGLMYDITHLNKVLFQSKFVT